MKQFIHTYKKALVSGAVCLVLALALAAGSWAALSAPRQQPDAPEKKDYPGLNIQQIGLRYDRQSPTQDGAAGDDTGDGQAQQNDPQQETPPQDEAKPNDDQTPEEQPDPGDQDQQPEQKDDQDKKDDEGPVDEDKKDEQPQGPQIATDLRNRTISQEELKNDLFTFTAMVVGGDENTSLQVSIKNSQTKGKWLTASGDDYTTKLALGRNEITIVLKRGAEIIGQVTRVINYQAALANEDEPEKGNETLNLRTTLDEKAEQLNSSTWQLKTNNGNLSFTLWATDKGNNPIYQDHITVKLDGKEVKYSTGSGISGLEYDLRLDGENGGRHTVTVLVRDDKGNSAFRTYIIDYNGKEQGEKIGTATVRLDLSVLGLGVIEAAVSTDIFQDVPASYAVKTVLESLGYEISYGGTLDNGFYLRRISRGMTFEYAEVPAALRRLLEQNHLSLSQPGDYENSVGEFDYTRNSGWMYSVNGIYPGRGLSGYFLSDGDMLTLRFTLANGNDIGGGSQNYCEQWIDGRYIVNHSYQDGKCSVCGAVDPNHTHQETETVTKAATCTEAGEKSYTCSVCGETHTEVIPAAGHHYENGKCTGCGQADPDAAPEPEPEPDPKPEPDPEPEPTPDPEPEPGGEETQNENNENAA